MNVVLALGVLVLLIAVLLVALKRRFGVSVQAIAFRCKDLGIIDAKAFSDLYREFKRRGWRDPPFEEPAVMLAEEEEPKRFERLCLRALAENVIGEGRAAEDDDRARFEHVHKACNHMLRPP